MRIEIRMKRFWEGGKKLVREMEEQSENRDAIGALQNKHYILLGSDNSLKSTQAEMGHFLLTGKV
jgi:hypothetical protein